MLKHIPEKFKKLTIVIPPSTDVVVISCPGIGPRKIGPKDDTRRSL